MIIKNVEKLPLSCRCEIPTFLNRTLLLKTEQICSSKYMSKIVLCISTLLRQSYKKWLNIAYWPRKNPKPGLKIATSIYKSY